MTTRVRFMLGGVAIGTSLLACDPAVSLRVSVRSTASCASPASSANGRGPSVAGAQVTLSCPDEKEAVLGTTDASGQFAVLYAGLMEAACSVTVRKPGYEPQRFAVDELCLGRRSPKYCYGVVITADLSPQAAPPHRRSEG